MTEIRMDVPPGGYPAGCPLITVQVAGPPPGQITVQVATAAGTLGASAVVRSAVPLGATVSPLAYPAGWDHTACYRDWAAQFGMPEATKLYLASFPSAIGRTGQLRAALDCGIRPVICFASPGNRLNPAADSAAFSSCLAMLDAAFPEPGWLVFEQEPNTARHAGTGWGPAAFTALSQARCADARATAPGWQVLFCPSAGGTWGSVTSWYPGPGGCDGIAPDHYCGRSGTQAVTGFLDAAAALCARDSLPAGVGWLEFGITAGTAVPSAAEFSACLDAGVSWWQARTAAGLPCAPWLWWNGPLRRPPPPGANTIWPPAANPANAWAVPLWQDALARLSAA